MKHCKPLCHTHPSRHEENRGNRKPLFIPSLTRDLGRERLEIGEQNEVLRHVCVVQGGTETGGKRRKTFLTSLLYKGSALKPFLGQNSILACIGLWYRNEAMLEVRQNNLDMCQTRSQKPIRILMFSLLISLGEGKWGLGDSTGGGLHIFCKYQHLCHTSNYAIAASG